MKTVGLTFKRQPGLKQTKADIIKELETQGIAFDKQAKLDELKALLEPGSDAVEADDPKKQ